MNALETLVGKLVLEGVMDEETTMIARQIMNAVKTYYLQPKTFKEREDKSFYFKAPLLKTEDKEVGIRLNLKIDPTKKLVTNQSAQFGYSKTGTSDIQVNVLIPAVRDASTVKSLEKFYTDLKGLLRHELEHAQQKLIRNNQTALGASEEPTKQRSKPLDPVKDVYGNPKGAIAYFTKPYEVEAYVVQLARLARQNKTNFMVELDKMMAKLRKNFDKFMPKESESVVEAIRAQWLQYAKTRYRNVDTSI